MFFKKLLYVIKWARIRAKLLKQPTSSQLSLVWDSIDPDFLVDLSSSNVAKMRKTLTIKNAAELIRLIEKVNRAIPIQAIKASDIPNGNFETNLVEFFIDSDGFYINTVEAIMVLKELMPKYCEKLKMCEGTTYGNGEHNARLLRKTNLTILNVGIMLHNTIADLL